jgi:hypothetical protein
VNTQVAQQADGSVVERLALAGMPAGFPQWAVPTHVGTAPPSVSEAVQRLGAWLDAVTEARAMTVLAASPGTPRNEGQKLPELVDPAKVRNWAEFMDLALALRWKAFAEMNGFSEALLQRPEEGAAVLMSGSSWRRYAVSQGSKRSTTGQQALQEWLRLPMREPTNPWLSGLGGYRY